MNLEMTASEKIGTLPDFALPAPNGTAIEACMEPMALLCGRLFSTSYLDPFFRSIVELAFLDPSAKRRRQYRRYKGD